MRLLATADLHYEMADYRSRVEALAGQICAQDADVLALAGDLFAVDPAILAACLHLFDAFRGEKLLVAGNHDLWTQTGDSFDIYDRVIPQVAGACGFHNLDAGPKIVGDVGLVGTVGWYDYSFRDESLGIPLRFYEHKAGPGYALRDPSLRHLLDPAERLSARALDARSYWNDGRMVRWTLDDRRFTALTTERLETQLAAVEPHVRAIVAITHHVPFRQMIHRKGDPTWDFANAFLGSDVLGETLLRHPKVSAALFGHSHTRDRLRIGHIDAINVGCTYKMKRFDSIDI